MIIFSVDGATKKSYEKVRIGLNYENVISNIKRFIELKKKVKSKKPIISIDMVQTKFNEGETEPFKRQWEDLVDEVVVRPLHIWGGKTIDKELLDYSKNILRFNSQLRYSCFYLWKSMFISQNGKTALCCVDAECEESYGDVSRNSIKNIWQGEKLKKLRKLHLCGKFNKIPLCSRCNFYLAKEAPWWWI